ncbi:ABC transporter permease [Pseudonocardia sp. CA-107938]|uniref:ABC transporter permease n=1 Tax=Pseudonocardia sp. CA-107938 TaxID=3240021 RepID=UPI003D89C890
MSSPTRPGPPPSGLPSPAIEVATLIGRSVRHTARSIDGTAVAIVLPVLMLFTFVFVFGGAMQTGTDYLTYVVPGIIVLCAAHGSAMTATSVNHDLATGMVDRIRSLPVLGASLLIGHVVAGVLRNLVSAAVVVVVAVLIGFRPAATPLGWVLAAALLALFMAAFGAVSAAWGLLVRGPEAAGAIAFVLLFLPYVSSAFVPTGTMPEVLRGFAQAQPITPVVETLRALLLDRTVGDAGVPALLWCIGLLIAGIAASGRLFRRRTS